MVWSVTAQVRERLASGWSIQSRLLQMAPGRIGGGRELAKPRLVTQERRGSSNDATIMVMRHLSTVVKYFCVDSDQ